MSDAFLPIAVRTAMAYLNARHVRATHEEVWHECVLFRLLDDNVPALTIGYRAGRALVGALRPVGVPLTENMIQPVDVETPPWRVSLYECSLRLGACFPGAETAVSESSFALAERGLSASNRTCLRNVVLEVWPQWGAGFAVAVVDVVYGFPRQAETTSVFAAWLRGSEIHPGQQAELFFRLAAEIKTPVEVLL